MMDINHILVVLDSDHPEQIALDKAIWLASVVDADITLLTSVYEPYCGDESALDNDTVKQIRQARLASTQRWIDSFLPEVSPDVRKVSTRVLWHKHLHNAVLEVTHQQDFDLVIKGTLPHSVLDRIFTHTDWNLMRHCPAPVLLVKSPAPWKHNRLLASVDATTTDEGHQLINDNILSYAEHLADHFETDLHLVNAYPQISVAFAMVPEVTAPDDIQDYITEQHQTACEALGRKYNVNADHLHVMEGEPDAVVAKVAANIEADVVVVGTVARCGVAGVLIGNTAEQLVDEVHCDVLVVKPLDGVKPEED